MSIRTYGGAVVFDRDKIEHAIHSAIFDWLAQIVEEMVEEAIKRAETALYNISRSLIHRFFRALCSMPCQTVEVHDFSACYSIRLALEARGCVRLLTTTFLEYIHTLREICLIRVQDRGGNETSDSDYGHYFRAIPA